jgi:hypothetical protein
MRFPLAALLFLTTTLSAQTLVIEPLQPTSDDNLTITVKGSWFSRDCTPRIRDVDVDGDEIRIELATARSCNTSADRWSQAITIGAVDAGLYRVRAFIDGTLYRQATLRVADAHPPFEIYLPTAPERGGTKVSLIVPLNFCYATTCEPVSVTFGGVPSPKIEIGNQYNWLIATVPAHAAGVVDVKIANKFTSLTAEKAFLYFDEEGPADHATFRPLLFPLLFEGDGALGTHWTTQVIVANPSAEHALITQRPLDDSGFQETQSHRLAKPALNYPRGYVWLPIRDRFFTPSAALTVMETTRGSAFELPVVTEDEFTSHLTLTGIPHDPARYRVTLRVYSLDPPDPFSPFNVSVFAGGIRGNIPRGDRRLTLTREREEEPWFGMMDLRDIALTDMGIPQSADKLLKMTVGGSETRRVWAFVSVTDNETQQTRIITPLK